jgi:hypothetical protein
MLDIPIKSTDLGQDKLMIDSQMFNDAIFEEYKKFAIEQTQSEVDVFEKH